MSGSRHAAVLTRKDILQFAVGSYEGLAAYNHGEGSSGFSQYRGALHALASEARVEAIAANKNCPVRVSICLSGAGKFRGCFYRRATDCHHKRLLRRHTWLAMIQSPKGRPKRKCVRVPVLTTVHVVIVQNRGDLEACGKTGECAMFGDRSWT